MSFFNVSNNVFNSVGPVSCSSSSSPIIPGAKSDSHKERDLKSSSLLDFSRQRRILGCLVDVLMCHVTVTPLVTSIFCQSENFHSPNSSPMAILHNVITTTSESTALEKESLRANWMLFLLPFTTSLLVGYVFGLAVTWQCGLITGVVLLALFFVIIGVLLNGVKHYSHQLPTLVKLNYRLASFLNKCSIILDMIFRYPQSPRQNFAEPPSNVRILHVRCKLNRHADTCGALLNIFYGVQKELERQYSPFITNLQRINSDAGFRNRRWKQLWCVPTCAIVFLFIVSLLSVATLLRIYQDAPMDMFKNKTILSVMVLLSVWLVFGAFCVTTIIVKLLRARCSSQWSHVKETIDLDLEMEMKENGEKSEEETLSGVKERNIDSLLVEELICISRVLNSLDQHFGNKWTTRVIVSIDGMLDGADSKSITSFLKVVRHLFSLASNSAYRPPFCIVLFTDFRGLLHEFNVTKKSNSINTQRGTWSKSLNQPANIRRAMQLVQKTVQLPIFMEETMPKLSLQGDTKKASKQRPEGDPYHATTTNTSGVLDELSLAQLAESKHYVTQQLIPLAQLLTRLLQCRNVSIALDRVILWISMNQYWPYTMTWMILHLQQYQHNQPALERFSMKELMTQVQQSIPRPADETALEEYELVPLAEMDSDPNVLTHLTEKFSSTFGFSAVEAVHLIHFSPFLNPFLLSIVQDYGAIINGAADGDRKEGGQFASPFKLASPRRGGSFRSKRKSMQQSDSSPSINSVSLSCYRTTSVSTDARCKTPLSMRRCVSRTLEGGSCRKTLSQLSGDDICLMLEKVEEMSAASLSHCREQLHKLEISGLVLRVCDLQQLRHELALPFGEWQIFQTLILHLRELEIEQESQEAHEFASSRNSSVLGRREATDSDSERETLPTNAAPARTDSIDFYEMMMNPESVALEVTLPSP